MLDLIIYDKAIFFHRERFLYFYPLLCFTLYCFFDKHYVAFTNLLSENKHIFVTSKHMLFIHNIMTTVSFSVVVYIEKSTNSCCYVK